MSANKPEERALQAAINDQRAGYVTRRAIVHAAPACGSNGWMTAEGKASMPQVGSEVRSRVVLVEDHAILREGLRALLELEPDLEIAGEATNGIDAVALVESLSPTLVITDIALPGRSGIELIRCLRDIRSELKILVLTAHGSEEYIRAALNAGTDGYVLKDASRADLLQAVRAVLSGQTYLCSSVTAKVV